jgi:hypothetical protein
MHFAGRGYLAVGELSLQVFNNDYETFNAGEISITHYPMKLN